RNVRVWPLAVSLSAANSSRTIRATPSNARPRLASPMPWLSDHNEVAAAPVRYRAELMSQALVMAGLGGLEPTLIKYCRSKAAAPAMAGVEWLVPEEVV